MFEIGENVYEVIKDHKDGWNSEAFSARYSEILVPYDYIVGDWGYNQLRLKGFFKDNHPKASTESCFSSIIDYLQEYCNFGCAYFILAKTDKKL